MSSLRGWRTTLVRRGHGKLVGETGLAPAWAFAREFLRLVCIRSTTRRRIGADRGNRTLMSFRPSAPRADVSTFPPRPQKLSIHRAVRPAVCLTKTVRRFLRVGCKMAAPCVASSTSGHVHVSPFGLRRACSAPAALGEAWSKRKDLHLRSPSGRRVYGAPHLLLFAALPKGRPLGSPTRCARGFAISALRAPSATLRKFRARVGLARAPRARCFALRLRRPGRPAALPDPKNRGSSRSCTCDRLLMRELRSLLRHRAKLVGRLGVATRQQVRAKARARSASQMLRAMSRGRGIGPVTSLAVSPTKSGCRGGIRTYISPLNRRPLSC
jgi:hypothetical protein